MKKISSEIIVTTFNQSEYDLRDFMEREIKTCLKSYHKPLITLIFESDEIQKANNLNLFLSQKYSKKQYQILINNSGRGFPSCLNFGILNSKSKYIFRLDTDDNSHKSRYDIQIEILEKSKAFICYSDIFEKETNKKINYPNTNLLLLFILFGLNPIPHISVCFNRNYILKNFGLYDEKLKRSEDFNLWIRALIIKGKDIFIKADKPMVYYSTLPSLKKSRESCYAQMRIRFDFLKNIKIYFIVLLGILPNLIRYLFPKISVKLKQNIQKFKIF